MFERLGFHYFADTLHYRQHDLETWLPVLTSLGASWVTLPAPNQRAIPEDFIRGLLGAGIQPVIHFSRLPLGAGAQAVADVRLLAQAYAGWGVRYVAWFDHPNCQAAWGEAWSQGDLVEHFLDGFLPLAHLSLDAGLQPVLPPFQPGGDYWDVAFLRRALKSLRQRGETAVLDHLALGADAWVNEGGLEWGAGGPHKWPQARPYACPPGCQDQRGFRIFDWYAAIAQEEAGRALPILLLRAGKRLAADRQPRQDVSLSDRLLHAQLHQTIARCLDGDSVGAAPPSTAVLACNLWLLAAEAGDPHAAQAWFVPGQEPLAAAGALQQWARCARQQAAQATADEPGSIPMLHPAPCEDDPGVQTPLPAAQPDPAARPVSPLVGLLHDALFGEQEPFFVPVPSTPAAKPDAPLIAAPLPTPAARPAISHYVLLPLYAWGAANWDLALIEPMLSASHPTIGFSLAEAQHAARVTVVGGEGAVSVEAVDMLRRSGCQVERILDDGTLLAPE